MTTHTPTTPPNTTICHPRGTTTQPQTGSPSADPTAGDQP